MSVHFPDPATPSYRLGDDAYGVFISRAEPTGGEPSTGFRLAVKDNIDVAGFPTTHGFEPAAPIARRTAVCVSRLVNGGARVVGKTNLVPAALGVDTISPIVGRTRNPRDADLIAGGSSGGSAAAIAANMADVALGTDTGGSVRGPAACCAVPSLKPTHGAIPMDGAAALAPTLDHIGLMARDIETLRHASSLLLQLGPGRAPPLGPRTIAYAIGVELDEITERAWLQFLRTLRHGGETLEPVELPSVADVQYTLLLYEAVRTFGDHTALARVPSVHTRLEAGRSLSDRDYAVALANREHAIGQLSRIVRDGRTLCLPALSVPVPHVGQDHVALGKRSVPLPQALTALTCHANVSGLPAISLPAGRDESRRPFSVQLLGARDTERELLDTARRLDAAVHSRRPPC